MALDVILEAFAFLDFNLAAFFVLSDTTLVPREDLDGDFLSFLRDEAAEIFLREAFFISFDFFCFRGFCTAAFSVFDGVDLRGVVLERVERFFSVELLVVGALRDDDGYLTTSTPESEGRMEDDGASTSSGPESEGAKLSRYHPGSSGGRASRMKEGFVPSLIFCAFFTILQNGMVHLRKPDEAVRLWRTVVQIEPIINLNFFRDNIYSSACRLHHF